MSTYHDWFERSWREAEEGEICSMCVHSCNTKGNIIYKCSMFQTCLSEASKIDSPE